MSSSTFGWLRHLCCMPHEASFDRMHEMKSWFRAYLFALNSNVDECRIQGWRRWRSAEIGPKCITPFSTT